MIATDRVGDWVRSVGRLRWRSAGMRRCLEVASWPLRRCPMRILSGAGRGLRFHAHGANAGYVLGTTEPAVQRALATLVPRGGTVLDVGANVGFHAVIAARLVGPRGRVIGFEPLPVNRAALARNLVANGFRERATVAETALGRTDGAGRFLVSRVATWGKLADLGREVAEHEGEIVVPVRRLDGVLAERPEWTPDVVKIDVEGAECDVLDGGADTWDRARPTLLIELNGTNVAVAERLEAYAYRAVVLGSRATVVESPWDAFVVAVPAECPRRQRLLEALP